MKIKALLWILSIAVYSFQACDTETRSKNSAESVNEDTSSVDDDVSEFLLKAASGGMMEVQLGEMAEQNSKSQGVKNFGRMMIKDHNKANNEIKTLAAATNLEIPNVLSEDHEKYVNELTTLRGAEFDEKYMRMMVEDHREDIDLFKKAAKFNDPDISAFANKTLPVLKKHFKAAKKINEGLKK